MNIYKKLLFIILILNLHIYSAEQAAKAFTVTETPTEKQITSTSYLINYPIFPKGIEFKHLDKFREFVAYKTKQNTELTRYAESQPSFDDAELSLSIDDCKTILEDQTLSIQFVQRFFRYSLLISCINNLLDKRYFHCQKSGICCDNNLAPLVEKINDQNIISLLLYFNRIQTVVANYQQKHDSSVFYLLLDPHFFKSLIKFHRGLITPHIILLIARSCQAVYDMYRILINSILLTPTDTPDNHPCFQFFDEQELKLLTFYSSFNDEDFGEDATGSKFQEKVCKGHGSECTTKHFFGENNFIHFNKTHCKLIVELPEEFKKIYKKIYKKATVNGTSPLRLSITNAWSKKLQFPIFFSLPETLPTDPGFLGRVEKKIEKGAKTIAAEVKALMKSLELEEESKKQKPSSSTKTPKGPKSGIAPKKEQPSAVAAAADQADNAQEEPEQPSILYTFNKPLSTKRIEIDERISDWYHYEKKNCIALKKQGYLTPGTVRNRILEETTDLCGTQEKAIQEIIFRHQLPYSLIKNILSYGTIASSSTHARTDITAIIGVKRGEQASYYQGEITGEIKGKEFKIWHSFLRPIDNIGNFMKSTLEGHNSEYRKEDGQAQDDDSLFTLLGEDAGWQTDDQESHVIISRDGIQYTLFKN